MAKVLIATYSLSGTTQRVADQIKQLLPDADTYQIEVADGIFSNDMYETDAIATKQIQNNDYPALVNPVPDVSQYDLILVGSPVWRGRPATPVHTFLQEIQDFAGQVASFYTDAGAAGDYEQSFNDWAGALKTTAGHEGSSGLQSWIKKLV